MTSKCARAGQGISPQDDLAIDSPDLSALSLRWYWRGPINAKIELLMHVASYVTTFYFSSTLLTFSNLLRMVTHDKELSKLLGKIRSTEVVYNA